MKLLDLIKNLDILSVNGSLESEILDIAYDSRNVKDGTLFVCLEGTAFDGHEYALEAINNGAVAVVAQRNLILPKGDLIVVKNTRKALALMSANFFMNPASELITIGITGTKGKTTTSCMIRSILNECGMKTGLIGTLGVVIDDKIIQINNTTPESYEIQKYLRYMVDNGCKCAVIEASSIGLKSNRLDGLGFDYGLFTNFSEDHIGGNEHKDMNEYLECKSRLFKKCRVGFINIDDENSLNIINGHTCEIKTFGFSDKSNIKIENTKLISEPGYIGSGFEVSGDINLQLRVPIPGRFNVYNAAAAISVCSYMDINTDSIKNGLNKVRVKGRVEAIKVKGNYTLLIDYAHNAISMKNILETLREYKPKRLITLFGAGGNRPKVRRYEMGYISGQLSDLSVITEDNSRNEDVMDIISDIEIGMKKTGGKYIIIPNRKDAIRYCIENAKDGDIIVLAGKGHETYQEINGEKHHFDEREIIKEILDNI